MSNRYDNGGLMVCNGLMVCKSVLVEATLAVPICG